MSLDDLLLLKEADLGVAPCLRVVVRAAREMGMDIPEPEETAARVEELRLRGIDPGEFPTGWKRVEGEGLRRGDVLVMDGRAGEAAHLAIVTEPGWCMHWSKAGVIRSRLRAVQKYVRSVVRRTC